MTEPWVVTYRIDYYSGTMVTEFYRGDRAECERIRARSSLGEDDQRRSHKYWRASLRPAKDWDDLLNGEP